MTLTAHDIRALFHRAAEIAAQYPSSCHGFSDWFMHTHPFRQEDNALFLSVLRVILTHRGVEIAHALANQLIDVLTERQLNTQTARMYLAYFFANAGYRKLAIGFCSRSDYRDPTKIIKWLLEDGDSVGALETAQQLPTETTYKYRVRELLIEPRLLVAKACLQAGRPEAIDKLFVPMKPAPSDLSEQAACIRFNLARAYIELGFTQEAVAWLEAFFSTLNDTPFIEIISPSEGCQAAANFIQVGYSELGHRLLGYIMTNYHDYREITYYHLNRTLPILDRLNREITDTFIEEILTDIRQAPAIGNRFEWMVYLAAGLIQLERYEGTYIELLAALKTENSYVGDPHTIEEFALTNLFHEWLKRKDFESCEYGLDYLHGSSFLDLKYLLIALCEADQQNQARRLLAKYYHRLTRYGHYRLIEFALEVGLATESFVIYQRHPLLMKNYKCKVFLAVGLGQCGQWSLVEQVLTDNITLKSRVLEPDWAEELECVDGDIHVLIHAAAQLAPELDAIQHGLAFEVLSNCIHAAAQTHPEWRLVSERIGTIPES